MAIYVIRTCDKCGRANRSPAVQGAIDLHMAEMVLLVGMSIPTGKMICDGCNGRKESDEAGVTAATELAEAHLHAVQPRERVSIDSVTDAINATTEKPNA